MRLIKGDRPDSSTLPWKPKAYHKKAVRFMVERRAAGLFLDPGLGKTSTTLAAFDILRNEGLARGMLVVTKLRICYLVWPQEMAKWRDFEHLKVEILHGPKKAEALRRKADVYLINPEGLSWLVQQLGSNQGKWPFDVLTIDESTLLKNSRTVRFKMLKPLLPKFRRRYILTGTPAPNGLHDLWGQVYVLDQGKSLGRYITHYRMQYFDAVGFMGKHYVPREGAEERIYKAIAPYVLRMDRKDYLELPPLIPATHYVELPAVARKAYDKLEDEFLLEFERGKVTATNAAVLGGKLRQVANGGIYLDEKPNEAKRRVKEFHEAKNEVLIELLDELQGQPTLVAYEFMHDAARILRTLKKVGYGDVPRVGGGVDMRETVRVEKEWNMGNLPVLVAQPQSAAHGLNLQKTGRAVIWYSLIWNFELYDQFNQRIWRQGQTERVFIHHIIARGTTDESVLGGLRGKDRTQRALLDALRTYSARRRK
jgi:SNF2 family DNA or RNA helicase